MKFRDTRTGEVLTVPDGLEGQALDDAIAKAQQEADRKKEIRNQAAQSPVAGRALSAQSGLTDWIPGIGDQVSKGWDYYNTAGNWLSNLLLGTDYYDTVADNRAARLAAKELYPGSNLAGSLVPAVITGPYGAVVQSTKYGKPLMDAATKAGQYLTSGGKTAQIAKGGGAGLVYGGLEGAARSGINQFIDSDEFSFPQMAEDAAWGSTVGTVFGSSVPAGKFGWRALTTSPVIKRNVAVDATKGPRTQPQLASDYLQKTSANFRQSSPLRENTDIATDSSLYSNIPFVARPDTPGDYKESFDLALKQMDEGELNLVTDQLKQAEDEILQNPLIKRAFEQFDTQNVTTKDIQGLKTQRANTVKSLQDIIRETRERKATARESLNRSYEDAQVSLEGSMTNLVNKEFDANLQKAAMGAKAPPKSSMLQNILDTGMSMIGASPGSAAKKGWQFGKKRADEKAAETARDIQDMFKEAKIDENLTRVKDDTMNKVKSTETSLKRKQADTQKKIVSENDKVRRKIEDLRAHGFTEQELREVEPLLDALGTIQTFRTSAKQSVDRPVGLSHRDEFDHPESAAIAGSEANIIRTLGGIRNIPMSFKDSRTRKEREALFLELLSKNPQLLVQELMNSSRRAKEFTTAPVSAGVIAIPGLTQNTQGY